MNGLSWAPETEKGLWAHCRLEAPREAVGALLGHGNRVEKVWPLTNTEPGTTHYAVEPGELVSLYRWADQQGLELLAFYHSHPRTSAAPSTADLELAHTGQRYVIVSLPDQEIREFSV